MRTELAAFYVGDLSTVSFKLAMDDAKIMPVQITRGRIGWLRRDLDKWIARLAGDEVAPTASAWDR